MKISSKLILGFMLVMMICCVSAVSATDINSTDDAIITDEIVVDDVSEIVEDVEIDDASDDVVDAENANDNAVELRGEPSDLPQVNGRPWYAHFNSNGELTNDIPAYDLVFTGSFNNTGIGVNKLTINRQVNLNLAGATFNNVGIEILSNYTKVNGGTFKTDGTVGSEAAIFINGAQYVEINNTHMDIIAPNATDCFAIDVNNSEGAKILNNTITYVCGYDNAANYNDVIRAKNSKNMIVTGNVINATVPLKTVNWTYYGSIDADFVAGVAIENCENFKFINNTLTLSANGRVGASPTLDALLIINSLNSVIEKNVITEKDTITPEGNASYLYGIDVYSCYNIKINNNTVKMNADQSGGYVGGNGTGAAYCVQLTGPHTGVTVSNNKLTTKNNGPNAAIYSQNFFGQTNIVVTNNTITVTGKGTNQTWDVVTGMELQDDNATVKGNTITVTNVGPYYSGYNVYGISYSQFTNTTHSYNIQNNTIEVNEGNYTIYIMDGYYCTITGNTLNSNYLDEDEGEIYQSGNATVIIAVGEGNYIGPNP